MSHMNAREGFRRLGLIAGLIGAIVGIVFSYSFLIDNSNQRTRADKFSDLPATPEVKGIAAGDAYRRYLTAMPFTAEHPSVNGIKKIVYNTYSKHPPEVLFFEMDDETTLYPHSRLLQFDQDASAPATKVIAQEPR